MRFLHFSVCAVLAASVVYAADVPSASPASGERLSTEQANASVLEQIIGADLDVRSADRVTKERRETREVFSPTQPITPGLTDYYASQGLQIPSLEGDMVEKLWQPTFRLKVDGSKDDISGSIGAWIPIHQPENDTMHLDGHEITRAASSLAYIDIEGQGAWREREVGEDHVDVEVNVGVGYRRLMGDSSKQQGWIAGIHAYVDGLLTEDDNFMGQASLGLEARTKHASAYVNGYLPFEPYAGYDHPIEGNCAPRLGVDGGVSAHVPIINRLIHDNDYAELELYGQGYYYPDYDHVKALYGGVAGAQLKLEGDMGGVLKHYSTLEPYIEGVWDSETDNVQAKGGVEIAFPLSNPNSHYRATEIDPRYHRRMRDRAKRNIGFGGSACKNVYYKATGNTEEVVSGPQCSDANQLLNNAITQEEQIAAVEACNAHTDASWYTHIDCASNAVLSNSTNCDDTSLANNEFLCVDLISYEVVGYRLQGEAGTFGTCPAGSSLSELGTCGGCSCDALSFSGPDTAQPLNGTGGNVVAFISFDRGATADLDTVNLAASSDPAVAMQDFLRANGLSCININTLTLNDTGTAIEITELTYDLPTSCAVDAWIGLFGAVAFAVDNHVVSCSARDAEI